MTETMAMEVSGRDKLAVTQDQVTIARNTIAKGLSDDEFAVFLYNCQRQGIHPLDGLLIPISRNDKEEGKRLTFVTTVDLLRSRAAETNEYAGSDDAQFDYATAVATPQSATVTVWRIVQGNKCSFTATARWDEYYPGEKQGFMWRNKPHVMLGKCAEGLALRKAFPKQLAGLYLEEELQRESPKKAAVAKKPVGDVMCGECRAINGHLPSCPHRQNTLAASAQTAPAAQKSPAPIQTPPPAQKGTETMLLQVEGIEKKTRKDKRGNSQEYRVLTVMDQEGLHWTLFAWDSKHFEFLDPIPAKTNCIFEVKRSKSGDKEYVSIEHLVETGGLRFASDLPMIEKSTPADEEQEEELGMPLKF